MNPNLHSADRDPLAATEAARLTDTFVAVARRTADYYARRLVRTLGLPASEVDDLAQDLLLEVLIRATRYREDRAKWITFVDLVVRHEADVLAERQLRRRRHMVASIEDLVRTEHDGTVPIAEVLSDDDGMPALWGAITDPFAAVELALDVERFVAGLPDDLRRLCRLLQGEPVTEAQRRSGLSPASFYRELNELRMRLRAVGLGPDGTP